MVVMEQELKLVENKKSEKTNLEKNLIRLSNSVVEKLLTVAKFKSNFKLVDTESGEPALSKNDEIFNNTEDPVQEAIEMFQNLASNNPEDTVVLIGFEMGYAPFCLSENFVGNVIIFDPDMESVMFALAINDLSCIFTHHCQLTVDSASFTELYLRSLNKKGTTHIITNPYYATKYANMEKTMNQKIQENYAKI